MADNSNIEWCDASWPAVVGCTKKDRGCAGCYAILIAWIRGHNTNPALGPIFEGLVEKLPDGTLNWTGVVRSLDERLRWPIERWSKPLLKGHPEKVRGQRIFLTSMGDLWHPLVPTNFIAFAYAVMAHTPWHSYLVLTKRWDRAREKLSDPLFLALVARYYDELAAEYDWCVTAQDDLEWPLPNVVAMASASVQAEMVEACRDLLRTPAVMHGLSLEPLLGPIDLTAVLPSMSVHPARALDDPATAAALNDLRLAAARKLGLYPLDWVVAGGKSGDKRSRRHEWLVEACHCKPEARCTCCNATGWKPKPAALSWATSLARQCESSGITFMWKQWGGITHSTGGRLLNHRTYDGSLGLPVFNPHTRKWRFPLMRPVSAPDLAFATPV